MYTTINQLNPTSKAWVYVLKNDLDPASQEQFSNRLKHFCENWTAHEQPLLASFDILFNRVLLLVVDETVNLASGCSIDKSVAALNEMLHELKQEFLPRENVVLFNDDEEILTFKFSEISQAASSGQIHQSMKAVPTWVSNLKDWNAAFKQEISKTWLNRYFQQVNC